MSKHAIVIGAGFGGMAAALRLRARGFDVTVLERLSNLGGRGRTLTKDGFQFDAGPTVLTAPVLFEELFRLFGRELRDYVTLLPVKPWYRFRFHDGSHLDYGATIQHTIEEVRRLSPNDVDGYVQLLNHSHAIFEKAFEELATTPMQSHSTLLRELPAFLKLGGHRTVYSLVSKYLKDDRLRRAFSIQPLLVGGNPFNTTAIYLLIHFLERKWGIWFPQGGMGAMVDALARLMAEQGITVRTSTTVQSLETSGNRATTVVLQDRERLRADVIVCNGDPAYAHATLLPESRRSGWTDRKLGRAKFSMGLFVLYFATKKRYSDVVHHTIGMGKTYRETLNDVFEKGRLTDDFSYYLHRPTATDPHIAPPGYDTFYVLVPVPNLRHPIDWSLAGPNLETKVLARLERDLLPGLHKEIATKFYVTPEYFQRELLSLHGAAFSLQPTFNQSASFRFRNQSTDLNNLFFVGAGTHPGAGVPGVLCSAKIVDRLISDSTTVTPPHEHYLQSR